jgi:hypothetical protein
MGHLSNVLLLTLVDPGCPKCANLFRNNNKYTKAKSEFPTRAALIHHNKYDYSLVSYQGAHVKVTIICPMHGEFQQGPNNHINGEGCASCGSIASNKNASTKARLNFKTKANIIHNNLYDYSLVNYKNSYTKIKIICKNHGEFEQTPGSHINKKSRMSCMC